MAIRSVVERGSPPSTSANVSQSAARTNNASPSGASCTLSVAPSCDVASATEDPVS